MRGNNTNFNIPIPCRLPVYAVRARKEAREDWTVGFGWVLDPCPSFSYLHMSVDRPWRRKGDIPNKPHYRTTGWSNGSGRGGGMWWGQLLAFTLLVFNSKPLRAAQWNIYSRPGLCHQQKLTIYLNCQTFFIVCIRNRNILRFQQDSLNEFTTNTIANFPCLLWEFCSPNKSRRDWCKERHIRAYADICEKFQYLKFVTGCEYKMRFYVFRCNAYGCNLVFLKEFLLSCVCELKKIAEIYYDILNLIDEYLFMFLFFLLICYSLYDLTIKVIIQRGAKLKLVL